MEINPNEQRMQYSAVNRTKRSGKGSLVEKGWRIERWL